MTGIPNGNVPLGTFVPEHTDARNENQASVLARLFTGVLHSFLVVSLSSMLFSLVGFCMILASITQMACLFAVFFAIGYLVRSYVSASNQNIRDLLATESFAKWNHQDRLPDNATTARSLGNSEHQDDKNAKTNQTYSITPNDSVADLCEFSSISPMDDKWSRLTENLLKLDDGQRNFCELSEEAGNGLADGQDQAKISDLSGENYADAARNETSQEPDDRQKQPEMELISKASEESGQEATRGREREKKSFQKRDKPQSKSKLRAFFQRRLSKDLSKSSSELSLPVMPVDRPIRQSPGIDLVDEPPSSPKSAFEFSHVNASQSPAVYDSSDTVSSASPNITMREQSVGTGGKKKKKEGKQRRNSSLVSFFSKKHSSVSDITL